MLPDKERMCHCTGFTRGCRELVASGACQGRWVQLLGKHPQTGADVNQWDCIDNHAHVLRLALAQQQAQTGASVDRMRHEAQQRSDVQREALIGAVGVMAALPPALDREPVRRLEHHEG